jgi:hypothetical protein
MVAAVPCGGPTSPMPLGIHTEAGLGLIIRMPAIHGFPVIPGAGLPTTMAAGLSARASVGDGGRVAPGWDWRITRITLPQTRLPLALPLARTHCALILRSRRRELLVCPASFLSIRRQSRGRAWVRRTTSYSVAIPPAWESLAVAWATFTASPVRQPSTAWYRRLSIPMPSVLWGRVVKGEWVMEECLPATYPTGPTGPQGPACRVDLREAVAEAEAVLPTPPCKRQAVAVAGQDVSPPSIGKRVSHISRAILRGVGDTNLNPLHLNKSIPLTT